MTDHLKIVTNKCQNPLISTFLLEEQLQHINQSDPDNLIDGDLLFYNLEDCYSKLNERDLRYGLFKLYTINNALQEKNTSATPENNPSYLDNLYKGLNYVQTRLWDKAEEVLEDKIKFAPMVSKLTDLKEHITKYITEESWIEVQKNLNEWQVLHELSENTDRTDIHLESAYHLQRADLMEQLTNCSLINDTAYSFVYYMSGKIMESIQNGNNMPNNSFDNQTTGQKSNFKDALVKTLEERWNCLPDIYCEAHKAMLFESQISFEFEEAWEISQTLKKPCEFKDFPKIRDEILTSKFILRERIPPPSEGLVASK